MKRENVKYTLEETETQRRGNQGMRRRQEEHFSTCLNWFKPNNLCNTFTPISAGFDSGRVIISVHFSIRLAIVCSEWKRIFRIWLFQDKQECWADKSLGK